MKFGAKSSKSLNIPASIGSGFLNGLLGAIAPKLAAVKAGLKLTGMIAMAKLRANFRKWNRKDYGKRDDGEK